MLRTRRAPSGTEETRRTRHHRQRRRERRQRRGPRRERGIKLGAWVSNQRSRAATLTPERIEQLSTIGMRWTWRSLRCLGCQSSRLAAPRSD
ncbi:helicase associated domain-containing protein [Streptomyces sp. NPDC052773]|uniref:helicase associated domain-containing protein n=1 Tax=Streptomyces sp. NPDC052773 TaxID=3365693 RepID=UPI0037D72CDF